MSQATLERATAVDAGSDLASLVVAYHAKNHSTDCEEAMCRVARECIELDEMFYGTDG